MEFIHSIVLWTVKCYDDSYYQAWERTLDLTRRYWGPESFLQFQTMTVFTFIFPNWKIFQVLMSSNRQTLIWKGFSGVLNNFLVFYFPPCLVKTRLLVSEMWLNTELLFLSIIRKCKPLDCFDMVIINNPIHLHGALLNFPGQVKHFLLGNSSKNVFKIPCWFFSEFYFLNLNNGALKQVD